MRIRIIYDKSCMDKPIVAEYMDTGISDHTDTGTGVGAAVAAVPGSMQRMDKPIVAEYMDTWISDHTDTGTGVGAAVAAVPGSMQRMGSLSPVGLEKSWLTSLHSVSLFPTHAMCSWIQIHLRPVGLKKSWPTSLYLVAPHPTHSVCSRIHSPGTLCSLWQWQLLWTMKRVYSTDCSIGMNS